MGLRGAWGGFDRLGEASTGAGAGLGSMGEWVGWAEVAVRALGSPEARVAAARGWPTGDGGKYQ